MSAYISSLNFKAEVFFQDISPGLHVIFMHMYIQINFIYLYMLQLEFLIKTGKPIMSFFVAQ